MHKSIVEDNPYSVTFF